MNAIYQNQPRVLIVDDQRNWRESLCDMLDSDMYEIETAASYDEAKLRLQQRAFHVLVSDQRLVDADQGNIQGILLLDELNVLQDGTQAIIVTGYPTIEAAKEALRGRNAYDYILKYPEGGGPFNIRQYRQQVKAATEKAMDARQKAITLDFSLSSAIPGLTYDRVTEMLFPEGKRPKDALDAVQKVVNRLLYPLQPLAHKMGRVWLSELDRVCEILCWSRSQAQATLVKVGTEQSQLEAGQVHWVKEKWYPIKKKERFMSAPVAGVSYTIDEMAFEEFAALVEEG